MVSTVSLSDLSADDHPLRDRLDAAAIEARTRLWAAINTGSTNLAGLTTLAPKLADAFSALEADVRLAETDPVPTVNAAGKEDAMATGPVILVAARPDAPRQIVLSGHYDTVFAPGVFETIRDLGDGKINGPGLCDMKGGISVMLAALAAFEAGPLKDKLGYRVVLTPDEEIGNFASARFLTEAAQSGAHLGMTYEPAMEDGNMAGGRKGSAVFDIVLHGRAAHAGRAKDEGRSALEAAAELVVGLEALNGKLEGVSVNVGAIDGGAPVNIVPDLAIVRFGARAPDAAAAEWTTEQVRKLFDRATRRDGIHGHLHGGFYRPPKPRNAAQAALFAAVQDTGRAIGLSFDFIDTGGVCEGNNIFAAGVPNVDTLGVRGGRIHSTDEFVVRESFAERALLSGLLMNRVADGRLNAPAIKALMER